ncbi:MULTISPECIES: coenzyme F420-0:L-glutamate ligase [Megasphaera]|uniref:F420-0:Gamma-glutamyl ligase n=1 Tax=Megasphaera vaginalis (ex Srinivasan et al. 2021) TaxID=1111454 RepID=U7URE6_9FIRM|nr:MULTISPECIES: coenzyme F420-0:L-glutamate ligase [Megasphaera]ERT61900.1 F420-0:Gamma-glutamyl ligase [Megasphaera vaginalis (ex Srinivasan et al. 2021)]
MANLELIPVKTRILTDKDDIVDVIESYARELVGPDDIICTAESVVAITQRRYTRPEELTPSWQARLMRRFVPGEGSMASLYGMQAAMELEGEWKMLVCFIIGFIAKLFGKNGVWYKLCRQASLTDDVTGTMPPFDKCIVYGPAEPDTVAERIKERLGCYGACVADVNDLKRSAVLGHSKGLDPNEIARILIDNPFGNASQKTPIVIIKNYAAVAKKAAGADA